VLRCDGAWQELWWPLVVSGFQKDAVIAQSTNRGKSERRYAADCGSCSETSYYLIPLRYCFCNGLRILDGLLSRHGGCWLLGLAPRRRIVEAGASGARSR